MSRPIYGRGTGSMLWNLGRKVRRSRPGARPADDAPTPKARRTPEQIEAARLRVAEFMAGRPPLVLDETERLGLSGLYREKKKPDPSFVPAPPEVRTSDDETAVAREFAADLAGTGRRPRR